MSSSKYIQFRGIDDVMHAYKMRKIDYWAIFNGKEMFTKGTGENELHQFLEMLEDSACTYTLKVYEDVSDIKEIKDRTPSDGAFTFKLIGEEEDYGQWTTGNKRNKLLQRVALLEQKLSGIGEDDEEEETLEDVVIGTLKEPQRLLGLVNTIKGIFGQNPTFVPNVQQSNAMGNVAQQNNETKPQWNENDLQRIGDAIDVLKRYDESIVEHLEKLAKIAVNNTGQFNFLIGALNTM